MMQLQDRKWYLILAMALVLTSVGFRTWAEEKQPSEAKVAEVNGAVITQKDFENEMRRVERMFSKRGKPLSDSQVSEVKKEVLESLINRELLYQESAKENVDIAQATVDERLSKLKKRFADEAEFRRALSQMNLSEMSLKSQLKREMAIQQLIDEKIAGKVSVSDEESKTYYDTNPDHFKRPEEVRASHILIKVDPQADESQRTQTLQKIEEIQVKAKKGEDFAALAREFSEGPSAPRGGDLNYFRRGQMVKPFEDVAFALEPGEVSDIVETRFGYHVIKVTDKKPETEIAYDDVKGKIEAFLKRKKIEEETKKYVAKLREKAEVKRFLHPEP